MRDRAEALLEEHILKNDGVIQLENRRNGWCILKNRVDGFKTLVYALLNA